MGMFNTMTRDTLKQKDLRQTVGANHPLTRNPEINQGPITSKTFQSLKCILETGSEEPCVYLVEKFLTGQ